MHAHFRQLWKSGRAYYRILKSCYSRTFSLCDSEQCGGACCRLTFDPKIFQQTCENVHTRMLVRFWTRLLTNNSITCKQYWYSHSACSSVCEATAFSLTKVIHSSTDSAMSNFRPNCISGAESALSWRVRLLPRMPIMSFIMNSFTNVTVIPIHINIDTDMDMKTHVHEQIPIRRSNDNMSVQIRSVNPQAHNMTTISTCMHACIHTHITPSTHIFACMHVCIHTSSRICMAAGWSILQFVHVTAYLPACLPICRSIHHVYATHSYQPAHVWRRFLYQASRKKQERAWYRRKRLRRAVNPDKFLPDLLQRRSECMEMIFFLVLVWIIWL